MTRVRGRSLKGQRCLASVPHGHWKTTTFVGALRNTGMTAPVVLDGPMNGAAFKAYVEQELIPTLSAGDVVIMDNLRSHKVEGIEEAIEKADCKVLYLPPYSPDLNPIENAFSKFKAMLRACSETTINGLWDAVGKIVDCFSESECSNYFKAAGYGFN